MGMSTGATSHEYTANFMSALSDQDVCLLADKMEYADQVSQWAASYTLDAQKFARTLESGGREETMNGSVVFKLLGGTWKSVNEDGRKYSLKLGTVFKKLTPEHLHSALCYWHMASYDALMLHCIAIFVVNSLVKTLALKHLGVPLAVIPMPARCHPRTPCARK
jgi:hypothetical protein